MPAVEGAECYEIVLTPDQGEPVAWFLDVKSLLLVKTESKVGDTIIETYPSDYREVDGVLLPYNELELNLQSRLAYYKGRTAYCTGDGEEAMRLEIVGKEKGKDRYGAAQPHSPCGNQCPDFLKRCKPNV